MNEFLARNKHLLPFIQVLLFPPVFVLFSFFFASIFPSFSLILSLFSLLVFCVLVCCVHCTRKRNKVMFHLHCTTSIWTFSRSQCHLCWWVVLLLLFSWVSLCTACVYFLFSFILNETSSYLFIMVVLLPNACFLVSFNTYFTCFFSSRFPAHSLSMLLNLSFTRSMLLNGFIMPNGRLHCATRRTENYYPGSCRVHCRCHQPFQVDWFAFSRWCSSASSLVPPTRFLPTFMIQCNYCTARTRES